MIDKINEYLRVAVIQGLHGLDGSLKIFVVTDFPDRFTSGNKVLLKLKGGYVSFVILSFNFLKKRHAVLKLEGVDTPEQAERFRGIELFVDRKTADESRDKLDQEEYFYRDIIGCDVYINKMIFGTVIDILEGGAGDLLIIKGPEDKEYLIPFVSAMVDTSKIYEGRIDCDPVEGLLDV